MKLSIIIISTVVIIAIVITIVLLAKSKKYTPGLEKVGKFCNDDNVDNHCKKGLSCDSISEKLIVAAGSGKNTLVYSDDDGKTWNEPKTDVFTKSGQGTAVASGKLRTEFVVVGKNSEGNGVIAYSTDGKKWTTLPDTLFGKGTCKDVAYLETVDRFVAIGNGAAHPILYSNRNSDKSLSSNWGGWNPDQIFDLDNLTAIAASDKVFMLCGQNKVDGKTGSLLSNVLVSADGVHWGSISDTTLKPTYGLAYGAGKFVAVGQPATSKDTEICGAGQKATSDPKPCSSNSTGVMWYNGPGPYGDPKKGGGYPIGTGKNYWQKVNGVDSGVGYGITYGKDKFVMVGKWGTGTNTKTIYYSTDGITWNASNDQNILSTGRGVSWVGDKFIAFGDASSDGSSMAYSPDGINWTAQSNTPFSVGYGGGSNYQTTHMCLINRKINITPALN